MTRVRLLPDSKQDLRKKAVDASDQLWANTCPVHKLDRDLAVL